MIEYTIIKGKNPLWQQIAISQGEIESTNITHEANIIALVQGWKNQIFNKVALDFEHSL